MQGEHYFNTEYPYDAIASLATPGRWAVYVGLGATIDRTNVDWPSLISKLLRKAGDATSPISEGAARTFVESLGPQRAATAVEGLYQSRFGSTWIKEVRRDLSGILYSPRRHTGGRLLPALANWSLAIAARGGSVVFVTPNYDDYLLRELEDAYETAKRGITDKVGPPRLVVIRPRAGSNADSVAEAELPDPPWCLSEPPADWQEPGQITCVHIHGFVPDERAGTYTARGVPALGDYTYGLTGSRVGELLDAAFNDSHILVVGSSVTDVPLVRALIEIQNAVKDRPVDLDSFERHAFQPIQGLTWLPGADRSQHAELVALNNSRLAMMGLHVIAPDYFGQVSQVLIESGTWVHKSDRERVRSKEEETRYSKRVGEWWRKWEPSSTRPDRQNKHYLALSSILVRVRSLVKAAPDERLKIEVWMRREPNSRRQLALWASSRGPWPNHPDAIRLADIDDPATEVNAVKVFHAGAPLYLPGRTHKGSQWGSYYGLPIWHDDPRGEFMAGVIVIAGTGSGSTSCLSASHPANVESANLWLEEAGRIIADAEISDDDLAVAIDDLRSGRMEELVIRRSSR